MRILAMSGSLRSQSSNTSALRAAAILAPACAEVVLYGGLGKLPHFNPDLDTDRPPDAVNELRREIGLADGVLISSPEYAHGISGSFKNALDWLVSSTEFPGKPIALVNTSPRATHAQAHLREVLTTMSGRLIASASMTLPMLGKTMDAQDIASNPELSSTLRSGLETFVSEISRGKIPA